MRRHKDIEGNSHHMKQSLDSLQFIIPRQVLQVTTFEASKVYKKFSLRESGKKYFCPNEEPNLSTI